VWNAGRGSPTAQVSVGRVLIADDDPNIRAALVKLIALEESLEVVGQARDAEEAIQLARELQPDAALMDVNMPRGGGPRATQGIRAASPRTRIIAHSVHDDRSAVLQMIRAGAVGYLVKGTSAEDMHETLRRACRGEGTLSGEVISTVVYELSSILNLQEQQAEAHRAQVARVRGFIRGEGLSMLFQPVLELSSGRPVGVEALARFAPEPDRPAQAWFEEAGSVGYRNELELATMALGLRAMEQLPAGLYMALNVSPSTITMAPFLELLQDVSLPRLSLEISAHATAYDYGALNLVLQDLRRRGMRLAVDDFGAGACSLAHILNLVPDLIKLDGSVTAQLASDQAQAALAAGLQTFAKATGASLVAEGIESPEQLRALVQIGALHGQGFHLAVPSILEPIHGNLERGHPPLAGA
jgi:EAL domain-containing protein (putative c-di-GMP-specific phosphodiesterase class I)/ActR/RegA family two-component response regulator